MSLLFSAGADVRGTGELAKVTFQVIGNQPAAAAMKLEAVSFTNAAGQVIQAQLPPPLSLAPAR